MKHDSQNTAGILNFYRADPKEEGRLRHFLQQLARLCRLRGDMIPRAQEELTQKFLLNRRDRHHLQRMSHACALRAEEAERDGNRELAFSSRLEAWHKMPTDLSLLLDLAESSAENDPDSPPTASRKGLKYLKKAMQLSIGLEQKPEPSRSTTAPEYKRRLERLARSYAKIDWEHYQASIRALKGRARRRWPWFLLGWFDFALLALSAFYFRRRLLLRKPELETTAVEQAQVEVVPGEQILLERPVPVLWAVAQNPDFEKGIEKSRRLRLGEHYAYEVQGYIRVREGQSDNWKKPQNIENALQNSVRSLRPARPFELLLTYQHDGQKQQRRIPFSHGNEAELRRSPLMEGDTVLFREVFRMNGAPVGDEQLEAKINITGNAPRNAALSDDGFARPLKSLDTEGNTVSTVALAFRDRVAVSDGQQVRLLGYDVELRNATERPLDQFDVRLSWRKREGAPVVLERSYNLVSDSGTNLPGLARMSRRLWLELPEDINYAVEPLTPSLRIETSRFAPEMRSTLEVRSAQEVQSAP